MHIRDYLPSAQFSVIVGSVLLSGGLVVAAERITSPKIPSTQITSGGSEVNTNWQAALAEIQAQNSGSSVPAPANPATLGQLLQAATTPNVTETVGKTLLINLANSKSQGLGDDIPTQDALIESATAQINQDRGAPVYVLADVRTVADSNASMHAYGNAVITTIQKHPKASARDTYLALGYATDSGDAKQLSGLSSIGREYKALAQDLGALSVPKTISPLHLQMMNNFMRIADTYVDMKTVIEDPLRGLAGIQLFQSLTNETTRVFTTIATNFSKNGILFNTDEPGNTWSLLLPQ